MLLWRGLWDRSYWRNFGERFGFGAGARSRRGLAARGVGRRSAGVRARWSAALHRAASAAAADGDDFHPDRGGARAGAVWQRGAGALRALRPARRRAALLCPRAAAARGHLRDRAVAEPVSRVRPAPRAAGAGERAHLGALRQPLPAARAALHRHPVARRGGGGAGTDGCGALPRPRRGCRRYARHRQPQVRFRAAGGHSGARRAAARAVRRAAPAVGRGQHAWRWRGGGAAGRTAAGARQCPRGAAGDRAATPAALRRGRGSADAGRRTLHAPLAQQQCGGRLRGAAAGFPRRATGFLRRRGRGLRRRQPGGRRRPQPARAGGARGADPHRPVQLQQRGHCASADRAAAPPRWCTPRRNWPPA